jgi:hypothetical protein
VLQRACERTKGEGAMCVACGNCLFCRHLRQDEVNAIMGKVSAIQTLREGDEAENGDSHAWRKTFVRAMNHLAGKSAQAVAITQDKDVASRCQENGASVAGSAVTRLTASAAARSEITREQQRALRDREACASEVGWDSCTQVLILCLIAVSIHSSTHKVSGTLWDAATFVTKASGQAMGPPAMHSNRIAFRRKSLASYRDSLQIVHCVGI